MDLINGFDWESLGFGPDPPNGSDLARGSLHLKWYQSLGLGISRKRP